VKRPAGRPEIGPRVQVRLDRDLLDKVDTLAMKRGQWRAQVIRDVLRDYFEQNGGEGE
jgi:metal-responsive CopG/Arc/MetJ family transcriptional regulator